MAAILSRPLSVLMVCDIANETNTDGNGSNRFNPDIIHIDNQLFMYN